MAGLSALAHLGVAGLGLTLIMALPSTPPKPLPVTVMLLPARAIQSGGATGSVAATSEVPEMASATVSSPATPAVAEFAPAPPLAVLPVAQVPPPAKPEPRLKPVPKPKPKPKVESPPAPKPKPRPKVESQSAPQPKPTLTLEKSSPKPVMSSAPTVRGHEAEAALPAAAVSGSMAGAMTMATGAGGGHTQAGTAIGSGAQGAAVSGAGLGDSKPAPAYRPEPVYPAFARRLGYEGRVVLHIQVMATGSVGTVRVERSSGYAVLDEAALESVKRWRFKPAQRGGQPVDATLLVPITFKLQGQG